ncbi:MAG: hypothetical protein EHM61_20000 [Acidobacteria bacterium]|nr:MAG: hypothetical protein EHM61_20000 [Acidobacteriota bacterium]
MIGHEEEKIRQLFRKAREQDESEVPSFHAIVARARRAGVRSSHRRVLVAAAVMVFFAVISLVVIQKTDNQADLPTPSAVLYWESPTEAYLSPPGEGVLRLLATSEGNQPDRSEQ